MCTVTLIQDYEADCSLYPEDYGFYPAGSRGKIIDFVDIKDLPNLDDEQRERLMNRALMNDYTLRFLLAMGEKIVSMPVRNCRFPNEED